MKIALCYHGIAKGTNFKSGGLPVGYAKEFELLTKNLIEQNKEHDFDVFMHSWSLDFKDEVVDLMKPKGYLFEPSKEFKKPTLYKYIKENVKKLLGFPYEPKRINNIYSRWYSFYKACELVKESKERYDLVIVTRFDMCLLKPFNINTLDINKFYSGEWVGYEKDNAFISDDELKNIDMSGLEKVPRGYPFNSEGIQDFFFISSGEYMLDKFANIFHELNKLIKKNGPSNHLIALGKLKEDNMIDNYDRVLSFGDDYYLSRWL